jgi:hypothetical protein
MSYIISDQTVTIFHPTEFKPYTFHRADISEATLSEAFSRLNDDQFIEAIDLLTPKHRLQSFFARTGAVSIEGGVVKYNGCPIDNYATRKALDFAAEGLPYMPILAFIHNVMQNPSYRAVTELYQFLEVGNLPLTADGHFLAYKKVREVEGKLVDIYTGKIDNSVGETIEVPRNQVDEDPDRTCSFGLHVCSHTYLPHFGVSGFDKVVVVKVNPADVVAVPRDYNNAKMRVCKYQVMSILEGYTENANIWEGEKLNTEYDEPADQDEYFMSFPRLR